MERWISILSFHLFSIAFNPWHILFGWWVSIRSSISFGETPSKPKTSVFMQSLSLIACEG